MYRKIIVGGLVLSLGLGFIGESGRVGAYSETGDLTTISSELSVLDDSRRSLVVDLERAVKERGSAFVLYDGFRMEYAMASDRVRFGNRDVLVLKKSLATEKGKLSKADSSRKKYESLNAGYSREMTRLNVEMMKLGKSTKKADHDKMVRVFNTYKKLESKHTVNYGVLRGHRKTVRDLGYSVERIDHSLKALEGRLANDKNSLKVLSGSRDRALADVTRLDKQIPEIVSKIAKLDESRAKMYVKMDLLKIKGSSETDELRNEVSGLAVKIDKLVEEEELWLGKYDRLREKFEVEYAKKLTYTDAVKKLNSSSYVYNSRFDKYNIDVSTRKKLIKDISDDVSILKKERSSTLSYMSRISRSKHVVDRGIHGMLSSRIKTYDKWIDGEGKSKMRNSEIYRDNFKLLSSNRSSFSKSSRDYTSNLNSYKRNSVTLESFGKDLILNEVELNRVSEFGSVYQDTVDALNEELGKLVIN